VEIYNPTSNPIDLSNYKIRRYKNGQATWDTELLLSGNLAPYDVVVVTNGQLVPNTYGAVDTILYNMGDLHCSGDYNTSPMYFNGNDAMTIETMSGTIVDIFARIGPPDPENGWTDITDTTITYNSGGTPTNYTISNYMAGPLYWMSWTANHTLIRKASVKKGVTVNPLPFIVTMEWDSLPQNFWDSLGFHTCDCAPATYIPKQDIQHNVVIFPNPATSPNILIKGTGNIVSVELRNILGQTLIQRTNEGLPGEMMLNINSLEEGIYIVKVDFANRSSVQKKIIVKR